MYIVDKKAKLWKLLLLGLLGSQGVLGMDVRAPRPPQMTVETDDFGPDQLDFQLPRDLVARHITAQGDLRVGGNTFFNGGVPGTNSNVLYVKHGDLFTSNEFNSVTEAVNSIANNSVTNQFVIVVLPGIYVEDTIVLKNYVSLVALEPFTAVLMPDSASKDIIHAAPFSIIQGLQFTGASDVGMSAIVFNGGGTMGVDRCIFNNCNIFINQNGTTGPLSTMYLTGNFFGTVANFSTGIKVRSDSIFPTTTIVDGLAWQGVTNPSFDMLFDISGVNIRAFFNVVDIGWLAPAGGIGIKINNGASVSLRGASLNGFDTAVFIENAGSGPFLSFAGVSGSNNTEDLRIDHPATTGSISASFARSKIIIDPATVLALNLLDPENQGTVTVGPQFVGDQIALVTNISPAVQQDTAIGTIVDGRIVADVGLTVDVPAGFGYLMVGIAPDDDLKFVEWDAQSITLPANADSFIFIDEDGDVQTSLSRPSFTQAILLGKARTDDATVVFVQTIAKDATHTGSRIDESWRQGLGGIYLSGSIVTKNGDLQLDVSSGNYFFGTINFTPTGGSPISWLAFYRNGSGNYTIINQSSIDFDHYDDGSGTLASIPMGEFARHSLYIVNDGVAERYLLVYGQQTYLTALDAEAGGIPPQPGTWTDNITLIASVIVENTGIAGASSINEILDERPRLAFKASSVTAVTNHGDLTGLLNDDHPQYLLVNGTRAMSGNLNMGAHSIVNAGFINSVNIASHAARHLPNGADPLATALPVTIGTINSIGIANSLARSDHTHAHGIQTDSSLHSVATTTLAGFMSATDKTKLDGIDTASFVLKAGDEMTGSLVLTDQNSLQLRELAFNGFNSVALQAPSLLNSSYTLTLPPNTGLSGQVLTTDGSGVLNWSATGSGNINNGGNTFGADITLGSNDNFGLNLETNGTARIEIANTGTVTIPNLSVTGVVHSDVNGLLSTSLIVDADVDPAAAIVDTKLATISTAGKILNSATTAVSTNTATAIVARDASGNFAAGTITANLIGNVTGSLTGGITGAASLNVLKAGDTMTGSLQLPAGTAASPSLVFTGNTTTGISVPSANTLTLSTAGVNRLSINSSGAVTIPTLSSTGVVHNSAAGLLSTSLIVNADIDPAAGIVDTKLATISTAGKVANSATTATSASVPNSIVAQDASGNFSANIITATLNGNATTATTATNFSGSLAGDLTGTQSTTVVAIVGGQSAANVASATVLANAATSANTANAIVRRDASGNFSVGTITASLTGAASLNVLKAGDTMTGTLQHLAGTAAAPSIVFTGSTTTGFSAPVADTLVISTAGVNRLSVGSTGVVTIPNLSSTGVVHNSAAGVLSTSFIVNADVDPAAAIVDTKLATISTSGKVANSATTAVSTNTASAIVARDGSGNFAAGTITANLVGNVTGNATTATTAASVSGALVGDVTGTQGATVVATVGGQSAANVAAGVALANAATSTNTINAIVTRDGSGNFAAGTITANLTGNVTGSLTGGITGAASLNVLKAGDTMTGSLQLPAGTPASPSLVFTGSTTTGISVPSANTLTLSTAGTNRLSINSSGAVTIPTLSSTGVVHNSAAGLLSTSLIVNADIDPSANIADSKLATISTSGKIANSATTATSVSVPNTIVARDGSGNFAAGTITANLVGNVTGNVTGGLTGAASLNVTKSGDTMTGALTMSNQNQIRFGELSGSEYIALQAPASIGTNLTLTLPSTDGGANQCLCTNASGILNWVNTPLSLQNYRVYAYVGTNFSFSLAGTNPVPCNTKVFDPNLNFNASTYTYTAPVTGLYFVSANVSITASLALTRRLQLIKNGSAMVGFSISSTLIGGPLSLCNIVPLNAGDTLRFDVTAGLLDVILANDSSLLIYCISA